MSRYVTFGEIMLRLKSPGKMRFIQVPEFEATFGGGKANVAVGLANLGLDAAYVSVIPKNAIGDACIREPRKCGVNTNLIARKDDRLGIYFLEEGSNQRPLGRGAEPHTYQLIPENLAAVNSARQVAYPPFLVYLPAGKKVH